MESGTIVYSEICYTWKTTQQVIQRCFMQVIGYYICERVATPDFLHGFSKQIYSVSPCIGEQHPNLSGCFWQGYEKEKKEYQKRWNLGDKAFGQLFLEVSNLFEQELLDADGRFLRLADAQHVYERYFSDGSCLLLGISLAEQYLPMIQQQIKRIGTELPAGQSIGCDILGWDIGSFHTFLCNSLQSDVHGEEEISFNTHGLIRNRYLIVEQYAASIAEMGEPVDWLPYEILLYECEKGRNGAGRDQ